MKLDGSFSSKHVLGSKMLALLMATLVTDASSEGLRLRALRLAAAPQEMPPAYSAPGNEVQFSRIRNAPWSDIPVEQEEKASPSGCGPKCKYKCDQPACHSSQECDPLCEPPICETSCRTDAENCETRCSEPLCAVICPETKCEGLGCSTSLKCHTSCSPPVCTTSCADSCKTTCAKPACKWNCKKNSACPEPKCELSCSEMNCASEMSAVSGNATEREKARQAARVKLESDLKKSGRVLVNQARASLDPAVLNEEAQAPPHLHDAAHASKPPKVDLKPRLAQGDWQTRESSGEAQNGTNGENAWLNGALRAPASNIG
eukprot:TRINITY_DN63610_c0_g1_i1.p1 TRINITY_DN63610_c0_g1~~TRINITY_DN63610_c0_g1_i1.p1  ORF type:complete len:318 (-),score=65.56 TRINITY_DN63610_c0_g1_i1:95-1048(-)